MAVSQAEQKKQSKLWKRYLLIGIGVSLAVLMAAGAIYFWEELQRAWGYGYLLGFFAAVLEGITIIPFPSLLVTFTLARVLNPWYLGLVSGFGAALGEVTVYLTGAGGGALWSKLRNKWGVFDDQSGSSDGKPRSRSRGQAFYDRLVVLVQRRGGYWAVFITSALIWPLSYLVDLTAGTLRIGLKRFFLLCWAGRTIRGWMVAFAGYWGLYYLIQWIGV